MRIAFVNGNFEEIMEVIRVRGCPEKNSFDFVQHRSEYISSHSLCCDTKEVYNEIYTKLIKDGYVNLHDFKDSIDFKLNYSEVVYGKEE